MLTRLLRARMGCMTDYIGWPKKQCHYQIVKNRIEACQ